MYLELRVVELPKGYGELVIRATMPNGGKPHFPVFLCLGRALIFFSAEVGAAPSQLDGVYSPLLAVVDLRRFIVVLLVSHSASLGWLFLFQLWILLFWFGRSSQPRSPFVRRLDQLLLLLVPGAGGSRRRPTAARTQDSTRALSRYRTLSALRGSAWRWRAKLRAVYAQGYQAASETISSPGEVADRRELLGAAVQALKTERAHSGSSVPSREDPVVVLAYGLGAWPSGADLTSLEQLLEQLGLSHAELRTRFESTIPVVAPATQSRAFRELAGASFVLGAAARIVEAAAPPLKTVRSPGWLAAIMAHRR
jgi:hypothetical protein